jgi:hypothetical protein
MDRLTARMRHRARGLAYATALRQAPPRPQRLAPIKARTTILVPRTCARRRRSTRTPVRTTRSSSGRKRRRRRSSADADQALADLRSHARAACDDPRTPVLNHRGRGFACLRASGHAPATRLIRARSTHTKRSDRR